MKAACSVFVKKRGWDCVDEREVEGEAAEACAKRAAMLAVRNGAVTFVDKVAVARVLVTVGGAEWSFEIDVEPAIECCTVLDAAATKALSDQ